MSKFGLLDHNRLLPVLQSDHTHANLQLPSAGEPVSELSLLSAEAILPATSHPDNQLTCRLWCLFV